MERDLRCPFADPVYLKIDFLNGAKYNPQFDLPSLSCSEALGARIISSFYRGVTLKKIAHDAALEHIVSRIRADNPESEDLIVPIVVHFDEHGAFISGRDKHKKDGKDYFLGMLESLGSAATSDQGQLSLLHEAGHYFIVPITTGTSHSAANINKISTYKLAPVPLPVLTYEQGREMAESCLQTKNIEPATINEIIEDFNFRVALGDTGGLPGLVDFLCRYDPLAHGISFVQHLQDYTSKYVASNWDSRWDSICSVFFQDLM